MSGFDHAQQLLVARRNASSTRSGTVFKKTLGHYWVHTDSHNVKCSISSRLRKILTYPVADPNSLHPRVQEVDAIREVDPVAIGDIVCFVDAGDGDGMIVEVLDRRNALRRRASGSGRALEQVIVANVDQVVPVFAVAQPTPKWELLDRYLVAAEASGLPALICLTKLDLVDPAEIACDVEIYETIGYSVLLTSVATGLGLDNFRQAMAGRVSVFAGKSGVGKTSLLNSIQPGLGLRVNEVSHRTGKGKHTTTHLEMFAIEGGGAVVDTPGMREFGLWQVERGKLAEHFPEMRPFLDLCRFGRSCAHAKEPGCAVKDAVDLGAIAPRRYESYLRMNREDQR